MKFLENWRNKITFFYACDDWWRKPKYSECIGLCKLAADTPYKSELQ